MITITINGVSASRYGLILSNGGLSALHKPAPMKPFIQSKSRLQHGSRILVNNPKYDERTLILPVVITAPDEATFISRYNLFCSEILSTGRFDIIVSSEPTVEYHCVYEECQQYTEFVREMAKFMLKLTEPDPTDRAVRASS